MHDTLAVKLFSIDNLLQAYNNNLFDELFFMFPFTILGCSMNNRFLNFSERIFFLETIKNFCIKIKNDKQMANSFKYKIKNNIRDLLSTIYSFIYILKNNNCSIDLNRCSTSPLEHNFGIARICCRDNDRMNNLIKKFAILNVKRIDKFNLTKKVIRRRVTNYGIIFNGIHADNIDYNLIFNCSKKLISNLLDDLKEKKKSEIVSEFFNFLPKINLKKQKNSKFIGKSSDVYVNPTTTPNIKNRLKETITKPRAWSEKEVNLLKKLIHDIGGNCTLISSYFEKRNANSIYKKALKMYKKKEISTKPFFG